MVSDEAAFVKALTIFAGLVKFELTDDVGLFYVESLRPFGLEKSRQALMRLARAAKVGRGLPSIDEILELVAPAEVAEIEGADDAAVVAGLIEKALVSFGSSRVGGSFTRQREMIGELGWAVVGERWQHICDTTKNDDLPTLKAQWRNEVKGASARAKAMLPAAPSLPGGVRAEALMPAQESQVALPTAVRDAIDVASRSVAIDRKSQAAGERDESPW